MIHFNTDDCLNIPGHFGALGFMEGFDDIFHENAEKQYRKATEYILKYKEYFESEFYIDDVDLYSMVHRVLVKLYKDTEYHKVVDININLLICLYLYFKASYKRLVSIHKLNLDKRAEAAADAVELYLWMEMDDEIGTTEKFVDDSIKRIFSKK